MQRAAPEISIVVPVYNECESISELYRELGDALAALSRSFELIFVDDGSTDGTLVELKKLSDVAVVSFARNWGKSRALERGFQEARGRYIITIDGDLQDDPREIRKLLEALDTGSDIVVGWKQNRRDPFGKRFFSKIANVISRVLAGSGVHDMNCGLKGYRADVAKELQLYGDMHRFIPAMAASMGLQVNEVPIYHRARRHGKSKYGVGRLLSGLFDLMTLLFICRFLDRPMHFFGLIGIVFAGIGFITLSYLAWLALVFDSIIVRPLLFFGILLVVVGFQLLSLGFLGELLIRQSSTPPVPLRFYKKL